MSILLLLTGPSGTKALQGVVAAQSTTTGTLTVQAPLVAATAAQSVVTGALTNTPLGSNPLVGRIDAQSDPPGTLISRTITVRMIAITPSLNASIRPLPNHASGRITFR